MNIALGLLADIAVNTERIATLLEENDGEEERKKTDFTEQDERIRQARAYIARKEEELRPRRAQEAVRPQRR